MTKQRPELKNIINEHTSDKEVFQNKVIRPIIKMQNDMIMNYFLNYAESRKLSFESRTTEQQRKVVESAMNKDIQLKNLMHYSKIQQVLRLYLFPSHLYPK